MSSDFNLVMASACFEAYMVKAHPIDSYRHRIIALTMALKAYPSNRLLQNCNKKEFCHFPLEILTESRFSTLRVALSILDMVVSFPSWQQSIKF